MKRETTMTIHRDESNDELIGVLTAISVVSKRLAEKMTALSCTEQMRSDAVRGRKENKHHEAVRDKRRNPASRRPN